MEPDVSKELARLIGQSVSLESRFMIVLSRTSTTDNSAYGWEVTIYLYLPSADRAIPIRINEKAAFYYIFKSYYILDLYIVFCILPL